MLNLESGKHGDSSSDSIGLSSYTEAVKIITDLQGEYFSNENGFQAAQCVVIAKAYGFALELQRRPKLMKAFLAHEFFEKRNHKTKAANILRLTMFYLVRAGKKGPRYHRACTYTRALEDAFDDEQSEEEARALLEKEGIEWLARKGAKPAQKLQVSDEGASQPAHENSAKLGHVDTNRKIGDPTVGDGGPKSKVKASAKVMGEKSDKIVGSPSASTRKKKKPSLVVEMLQEDLLSVLKIPLRQRVCLVIEHVPSETKFKRMKAVEINLMGK